MQDGQFGPYYDRAAIDAGALADKGLEIAWVQDPVELFFLEIQGSGRLHLPDGSYMWIGYDTQNGYSYTGIGKLMRDRGLIGPNTTYATSMQGIKGLSRRPSRRASGAAWKRIRASFSSANCPAAPRLGAMGAPVIGHVSVAADPAFTPLGAPFWLSSDRTEVTGLWVAQDTGGAIKGANRVDTYWGAGVIARDHRGRHVRARPDADPGAARHARQIAAELSAADQCRRGRASALRNARCGRASRPR